MPGLDLKDLARRGAIARLAELQAEAAAILKEFPEVRTAGDKGLAYTDDGTTFLPGRTQRRRGRPRMSAAQRRAVSRRMKAYWANRRAAKDS